MYRKSVESLSCVIDHYFMYETYTIIEIKTLCGCYIVCRFIQKQLSAGQKLSFVFLKSDFKRGMLGSANVLAASKCLKPSMMQEIIILGGQYLSVTLA